MDTCIHEYTDTWLMWIHEHMDKDTGARGYVDTWIRGHMDTWTHENMDTWINASYNFGTGKNMDCPENHWITTCINHQQVGLQE